MSCKTVLRLHSFQKKNVSTLGNVQATKSNVYATCKFSKKKINDNNIFINMLNPSFVIWYVWYLRPGSFYRKGTSIVHFMCYLSWEKSTGGINHTKTRKYITCIRVFKWTALDVVQYLSYVIVIADIKRCQQTVKDHLRINRCRLLVRVVLVTTQLHITLLNILHVYARSATYGVVLIYYSRIPMFCVFDGTLPGRTTERYSL